MREGGILNCMGNWFLPEIKLYISKCTHMPFPHKHMSDALLIKNVNHIFDPVNYTVILFISESNTITDCPKGKNMQQNSLITYFQ